MYEKFSNLEIDSAGGGGEYTVQVDILFSFFPWIPSADIVTLL